jgi:hypothetical protein
MTQREPFVFLSLEEVERLEKQRSRERRKKERG